MSISPSPETQSPITGAPSGLLPTSLSPPRPPGKSLADVKRKFQLYGPDDLGVRCAQLGGGEYIVDGLLREQSLGLVVGDSGHGKTPLLYQLAMCVAAGVPFLGRQVKQGRVLYMDYENGLGEVDLMLKRLAKHLKLSSLPPHLLCWNLNDLTPLWAQKGYGLGDLVKEVHPVLTIIDPLGSQFPLAEEKNAAANQTYAALLAIMRTERTSFLNVHHLRKPGEESGAVHLEDGNVRDWFKQARGASSLINGCDIRLGVDLPRGHGSASNEVALVMGGFGRVRGETPLIRLARVYDDNGDPLGYSELAGVALLGNAEQQEAFAKLLPTFRFKEAKLAYGKAAQATTDFLNKCISSGILTKTKDGYKKIIQADQPDQANNTLLSNKLLVS